MLAGVDLIVVVLLVALIYYRGPVTDLLITWLWADGRDSAALADLVTGVLWGLIPTGVLLIVLLLCLRFGLHVFVSMVGATLVWVGFTVAARQVGLFA